MTARAARRRYVETECDNCFERETLRIVHRPTAEPAPGPSVASLLRDLAVLAACVVGVLLVGLLQAVVWLAGMVVKSYAARRAMSHASRPEPAVRARAPRRPEHPAATTTLPPRATECAALAPAPVADRQPPPAAVELTLDKQVEDLAKRLHAQHKRVMSPETARLVARRYLEQGNPPMPEPYAPRWARGPASGPFRRGVPEWRVTK